MVPVSLEAILPGLHEVMAAKPGTNTKQRGEKADGPLVAPLGLSLHMHTSAQALQWHDKIGPHHVDDATQTLASLAGEGTDVRDVPMIYAYCCVLLEGGQHTIQVSEGDWWRGILMG
eukprot:11043279-Alexandrium_andersonii.AAC.1